MKEYIVRMQNPENLEKFTFGPVRAFDMMEAKKMGKAYAESKGFSSNILFKVVRWDKPDRQGLDKGYD